MGRRAGVRGRACTIWGYLTEMDVRWDDFWAAYLGGIIPVLFGVLYAPFGTTRGG